VTEAGPGKEPVPPPQGSSKEWTTFKFYESADPIPQVSEVDCNVPLTEYEENGKYHLADVLTNENSPYKGAIKSVDPLPALPPPGEKKVFGKIERIDLSYHDLHRMHDLWESIGSTKEYTVPEAGVKDKFAGI
jgi:hypothetical protein